MRPYHAGMTVRKHGLVLGGLFVSLVLGASISVPAPADAAISPQAPATTVVDASEHPAEVHAEPEPGTEIPLVEPELEAASAIAVAGEVVVAISDEHVDDGAGEVQVTGYHYAVETAAGLVVPIAGDIPEEVSSGDTFEGSLAVDAAIVEQLSDAAATEVEASAGADALPEESAAAQEVIAAASGSGVALPVAQAQVTVAAAASTAGSRAHEIVLVVNSPAGVAANTATDAAVRGIATTAAAHWQSSSNGLIPSFTINATVGRMSGGSCTEDPTTTWNRAAGLFGHSNWGAFRSSAPGVARHLVVLNPSGCSETGVGVVGSSLHYGGAVRMSLGKGVDISTLAHEIGHNFGLGHADLHVCNGSSCSGQEYWDLYDVMGVGIRSFDSLTPLNAVTAARLGFMPTAAKQSFALPSGTATQTVTVTLSPLSAAAGVRHVAVTDPRTKEVFHLDLRAGAGAPVAPYYATSPKRTFGTTSVTYQPGVRMLRATGIGSALVAPAASGSARAAITVGQSLTSPSGGVKVSALSGSPSSTMALSITLASAPPATPGRSMPVYRFWSDAYQGHFYTISASEKAHIEATYPSHIWKYESVAYQAFTTQAPGTVPLYRFWSDTMNGHFYTASESEKNHVIAAYPDHVWKYERIAYYVYPGTVAGSRPVYRFWSDSKRHHFYTASIAERNHVIAAYPNYVWLYEMTAFSVPSS